MSPTPVALRAHEKRIAAMFADPDLTGDLLLIGLALARHVDFTRGEPGAGRFRSIADAVFGDHIHGPYAATEPGGNRGRRVATHGADRVRDVLRADIRRYEPDSFSYGGRCERPVRRTGTSLERLGDRCGRVPSTTGMFTDVVDGTRRLIGACRDRRCRAWWEDLRARNQEEIAAIPPPEPTANRGGVLARHVPEIDWPHLYCYLDPSWRPPHEEPGWRPPKLRILIGSDEDREAVPTTRPPLTVIEGGWR